MSANDSLAKREKGNKREREKERKKETDSSSNHAPVLAN